MGKDFFIRLLEFGERYPEGFNYSEIINDSGLGLSKWETCLVEKYLEHAWKNEQTFGRGGGFPSFETPFLSVVRKGDQNNDESKFIIGVEAKFKYIDYLELREARLASKQANKNALTAIIIAIFTLLLSIYFSNAQIKNIPKLDENQFQAIMSLKFDPDLINSNLNIIIKKQEEVLELFKSINIEADK
jgi:hypothetical protein